MKVRECRTSLSSSLSQFGPAQEVVSSACKDDTQLKANIHSKGRIEQTGDGTNVVDLCGSKQNSYQADGRRDESSPPNGKLTGGIPIIDIVVSMTEDEVFQNQDDGPGTQPVRNEEQEVGERFIKVGGSRYSDKHIGHCPDERPYGTVDALERLSQDMH